MRATRAPGARDTRGGEGVRGSAAAPKSPPSFGPRQHGIRDVAAAAEDPRVPGASGEVLHGISGWAQVLGSQFSQIF